MQPGTAGAPTAHYGPGFAVSELEKHVRGKGPDDLAFTNSGGECSTTQTFVATSGTQQPGRLAWMACSTRIETDQKSAALPIELEARVAPAASSRLRQSVRWRNRNLSAKDRAAYLSTSDNVRPIAPSG
jgi:hypothetical protein